MNDSGQTLVEYTAVIAMIAGIVSVLAVSSISDQIGDQFSTAICRITSGGVQDCGESATGAAEEREPGDGDSRRSEEEGEQQPGQRDADPVVDTDNELFRQALDDIDDRWMRQYLSQYIQYREEEGLSPEEAIRRLQESEDAALDFDEELPYLEAWDWDIFCDDEGWSDESIVGAFVANATLDVGPPGSSSWREAAERVRRENPHFDQQRVDAFLYQIYLDGVADAWTADTMEVGGDLNDLACLGLREGVVVTR